MTRRALLAGLALGGAGCGYRVSGTADTLPPALKSIAVPAFRNLSTRYKLTDRLPSAISREFLTRTRYRVVADEGDADAVLRGAIVNFSIGPTVFDPTNSRASTVQIFVNLQLTLFDRQGKVLYTVPNLDARQRYEVSTVNEGSGRLEDLNIYFDESEAALDRLAREVARSVVSAVLERF